MVIRVTQGLASTAVDDDDFDTEVGRLYASVSEIFQGEVRIDQAFIQAAVVEQYPIRVTQVAAFMSASDADLGLPIRINRGFASVCYNQQRSYDASEFLPSEEDWSDDLTVYTDVIFPECVSYGSEFSPTYNTQKTEVLSGFEQRNSRRRYPKFKYSINIENFDAAELAEILRIFHICSGDAIGFLLLDPHDHTSLDGTKWIAETDITPTDQAVAVVGGEGPSASYPLYKYYTEPASGRTKQRRIRYPKVDTMRVSVDGFEVTNFEWLEGIKELQFTTTLGGRS